MLTIPEIREPCALTFGLAGINIFYMKANKWFLLFLAVCLVFSFAACGGGGGGSDTTADNDGNDDDPAGGGNGGGPDGGDNGGSGPSYKHDAVLEKARVDVVRALPASRLFHHHRYQCRSSCHFRFSCFIV